MDAFFNHLAHQLVFGHLCRPLFLAGFDLAPATRFAHRLKSDRHAQGQFLPRRVAVIKCRQKVDAFHRAVLCVVVMPTDQLALIGVRLLLDAVVKNQAGRPGLVLANQGLYGRPKVFARELRAGQKARNLVMRDGAV